LLSWRFKRLLISSPVPRLVIRQKLSANRWGTSRRRRAANDPEAVNGQKIAAGSCISCHNLANAGGRKGTPGRC
jgi:mono/diheme cytochrome c family protein